MPPLYLSILLFDYHVSMQPSSDFNRSILPTNRIYHYLIICYPQTRTKDKKLSHVHQLVRPTHNRNSGTIVLEWEH